MRSVKIVRIIMLVAAFTLPLNAQQPHRENSVLDIARAHGIGICASVHAENPHDAPRLTGN